ncbi:MAG TPA: HEAT repeat domain-containing protein, partial [Myxococcota bacterium]
MAPSIEALASAQHKLSSALKAEREEAESVLVAGRAASIPFLVAALENAREPPLPGGRSPVPRAALLAGALKAREVIPSLCGLVSSGNAEDRPFIARALAEIVEGQDAFDDRVCTALEKLGSDPDRYTRAFAAQAFGALGDLRSKARVHALSQDADPWVREKASAVLARLAEAEAKEPPTLGDFADLVRSAEAAGGVLAPFLADLGDARRAVRDAAVAELVRAGAPAIPFLLDKLNQPHTRARIGAATALGRLQTTQAAGPLLVAATAPASTAEDVELRAVSLRALSACLTGAEEGLGASLLPLARDSDRFVRAAALLCLGRLGDRAGLRAIVQAIAEDDPFVVESAAVALSEGVRESDSDIVKPLLQALGKRSGAAVREAILLALSRVTIDDPALRVRVRHRVRAEVRGATA